MGYIFLAFVLGGVGVFLLATGFQAYADGFSWFGWTAIAIAIKICPTITPPARLAPLVGQG